MWLASIGVNQDSYDEAMARPLTPVETRFAEADGFEDASQAVIGRCSMCHAREPVWDGIRTAPKGVLLETPADIAAPRIRSMSRRD